MDAYCKLASIDGAHGEVVTRSLWVREILGSIPGERLFLVVGSLSFRFFFRSVDWVGIDDEQCVWNTVTLDRPSTIIWLCGRVV